MTNNEKQHLQVILHIVNMIFVASKPQTDIPAEKVAASAVAAASGSHSARRTGSTGMEGIGEESRLEDT